MEREWKQCAVMLSALKTLHKASEKGKETLPFSVLWFTSGLPKAHWVLRASSAVSPLQAGISAFITGHSWSDMLVQSVARSKDGCWMWFALTPSGNSPEWDTFQCSGKWHYGFECKETIYYLAEKCHFQVIQRPLCFVMMIPWTTTFGTQKSMSGKAEI